MDPHSVPPYTWLNKILRYEGRLVVGNQGDLRHHIWLQLHASAMGEHSGIKATVKCIATYFLAMLNQGCDSMECHL